MPEAAGRRPHVLTLVDSLYDGTGGAERFAVGLAAALPQDRFEVSFCSTREEEGYLPESLDAAGVRHFALGRSGRTDLTPFRRLGAFMRRENVDILHSHKFGSNVWGSLLGRAVRVPVVIAHEHTWSYEGQPLRRALDRHLIGRLCTRFVSVSNEDRRRMVEIEGVPAEKTLTIPTAYIPRPDAAVGDLRSELGLSPTAPTAGTIAQLRPQKALDVLLEAWKDVLATHPDAHLIVVGDGPCRQDLEAGAGRLGIAASVHFLGTRIDLPTIFAGLDVAVMSSDFEGLPLFVFEAMAHGTPLVATAVGGLPDLVDEGTTGLLVPPRDPEALAGAVSGLLGDGDRRSALVAAAAQRLPEFAMELIAERFADLYDELLAQRRR